MDNNETKEFAPIEIDLNPETVDEGYLRALGAEVVYSLYSIFGGFWPP